MKILYQGYLYEALEAPPDLLEYARKALKEIKKATESNTVYVGKITDRDGNLIDIETEVDIGSSADPTYKTYYNNADDMNITSRVINIPIKELETVDYSTVYYELVHELLHAIDPKSYDKDLVRNKQIGLSTYIPSELDSKAYRTQPLERQVHISTEALKAVELTSKVFGKEETKRLLTSGEILRYLNNELRSPKNDKEFLRLTNEYFQRL